MSGQNHSNSNGSCVLCDLIAQKTDDRKIITTIIALREAGSSWEASGLRITLDIGSASVCGCGIEATGYPQIKRAVTHPKAGLVSRVFVTRSVVARGTPRVQSARDPSETGQRLSGSLDLCIRAEHPISTAAPAQREAAHRNTEIQTERKIERR
ncbi:hypothetical protein KQX54_006234 [Cotesia glomerata]|uniref:Uncharacterized protein n=1 Tax=Cotesia glomerata TaxID=32391 RepID=A0AAV7I4E9_COTGL|nr:hypothetical protein KQX54_006234 [Cotesia glomerata]